MFRVYRPSAIYKTFNISLVPVMTKSRKPFGIIGTSVRKIYGSYFTSQRIRNSYFLVVITVTSRGSHGVSKFYWLFVQQLNQTNNNKNIKASHHWPILRGVCKIPSQKACNAESVCMLWRHHVFDTHQTRRSTHTNKFSNWCDHSMNYLIGLTPVH